MIKLQSLLLVGLCTLVCFIQAMDKENNQIEMKEPLIGSIDVMKPTFVKDIKESIKEVIMKPLSIHPNQGVEGIKELIKAHGITDKKIIEMAAQYFKDKIDDKDEELDTKKLANLFHTISRQLGAPGVINVNDLIQKRELTKHFYPTPAQSENTESPVEEKDGGYFHIQIISHKEKEGKFEHTCERCSEDKFVFLLGEEDRNTNAYCLDCAISDLNLEDLIKHDYVELVVIYLLTQAGFEQTRFQDSTIVPQLIADALMIASASINYALDSGSDNIYAGEYVHTWNAYHLLMIVYFTMQFVGTSLYTLSMYSKRLCNGNNPISVCAWNGQQTLQAIIGAVSVVIVSLEHFRAADMINGIMLGLSAANIWTSQNIALYEKRYIAWNENHLSLWFQKGLHNKQIVLNNSWKDKQGIFSKPFASIAIKAFCCANGFIAWSLIPYYTGAGEAFNMPRPFIHSGLIGNVMIWGSWFILTIGSFFMPEMAWDSSLSFSYKLLQIGLAFGIMLCTASFNHQTKLYINFGSFMIPLMLFVGKTFYDAINRWRLKETTIPTMPKKSKYSQLKFIKKE